MKTIGELIQHVGLADEKIKDFVCRQKNNIYEVEKKDGYYIGFTHKFYKNNINKLISQEKLINRIGCETPEQAWENAALVLLNLDESLSFS